MRFLLKLLFCAFLLWLPAFSFAQGFIISGMVVEGKEEYPMPSVNVRLSRLADSTKFWNTATDIDGAFVFTEVPPDAYVLKVSYVGYFNVVGRLTVINSNLDAGKIPLVRSAKSLSGVTISAEQIRAQQSGDTTQFNAGSFKTNRDASAEELITKMPGIVNEGGKIKSNGEDVKKILVDGKDFFGDDPNAALKNLPAEIIEKIQVFDRASDQAQFTGFDDGNSQKTINIITKKGRNNGVFGKITTGAGWDNSFTDFRYTAGGNLNFFNGDRRISLVGLVNNVNQQNFSSEDLIGVSGGSSGRGGRFGGGGGDASSNFLISQQGGINITRSAGINYSDQWGKNLKVSAGYFFNSGNNSNTTTLTRNYITSNPDSSPVYNETAYVENTNYNHRASGRLEWTPDSKNSVILNPKISYQDNSGWRRVDGLNNSSAGFLQSRISNDSRSDNTAYNLNNQLTYRHKFDKNGRTISLNLGTGYNNKTGTGTLNSDNFYSDSTRDVTDQYSNLESDGLNLSGNLTYTEPVSKNGQVMATYSPSYNHRNSERETFKPNALLDTSLSNFYKNDYYYQRGGIGYRHSDRNINFNASLNAQYAVLSGSQTLPVAPDVDRNFKNLLPHLMLNYKFSKTENIRIMYRTNTNAPDVTQLQQWVDNSNPLLLRTGNPDLQQDYSHSLTIRYGKTGIKKEHGLFIFANGSLVENYVGNSMIIATRDTTVRGLILKKGSQLSYPVNLDGNATARSFVTWSQPLKKLKTNLNINTGINYNRLPAMINGRENFANNYALSAGLVAGSNISEKVDFTLSSNAAYTIVKNSLQAQSDNNYYTQTTSLRFNWIFAQDFVFNTNATHTLYSGLSSSFNQSFLLWNASLGYKFLKSKALQADLYAFDILGQNQSISRTITENYIEDAGTRVLSRYFMLRLSYTIRAFKSGTMPAPEAPEVPERRRHFERRDWQSNPFREGK